MIAHKYGSDAYGHWDRDGESLPCYEFNPLLLPRVCPPLMHLLSTGRASLLADQFGTLQIFTNELGQPCCLSARDPRSYSALHLRVTSEGETHSLLLNEIESKPEPVICWGIGYISYQGTLGFKPDKTLSVDLTILAPPDQTFFVACLSLKSNGADAWPLELEFFADVTPAPAEQFDSKPHVFVKDGAAIFADIHPELTDVFLAGDECWDPGSGPVSLSLNRQIILKPQQEQCSEVLFGYGRSCSVDWLRQQREEHTAASIKAAWTERLGQSKIKAPELWMQEECLWNMGRLLSFASPSPTSEELIIVPGGASSFMPGVFPERATPSPKTRDILSLTLPLMQWDPKLALANLSAATACQSRSGRMAESLKGQCDAHIDPSRDRSDLEIWLLLAWTEYITLGHQHDLLERTIPFADGGQATVWEHLRLAYQWIRDDVRQGHHGLIRMLAGDWNGYLNRVGVDGKGESVLNTAMTCYALQRLEEIARTREEFDFADQLSVWNQKLRMAVGDAFDGAVFLRAYSDNDYPVGTAAESRIFPAVQAWAVLACCGTADQRKLALANTLKEKTEPAIAMISRPYPLPPPHHISDLALAPGEGENAGIAMAVAAWFVWALASEGHRDLALQEWERLSVRRRAAEAQDLPAALLTNLSFCDSSHARHQAGLCAVRELQRGACLPTAHAVAWQDFALRKIVS